MHVIVKGSIFRLKDTTIRLNRNILRSELKIDTKSIMSTFRKNRPISYTPIYSFLLNIRETMLIRLLAITCEKNSNNPIEIVPVRAQ